MQPPRPDEDARRAYWAEQMEAAYDFMMKMLEYPVAECGEPLAPLPDAAASAGVTVHFSDTKIAGRYDHLFYLREGLIEPFIAVAREMNERGWILKVEDGYRTTEMQRDAGLQPEVIGVILQKVMWENKGEPPSPDLLFRRMTALCATYPKTGTHMSGSAMDISVLHADTLSEVDRGGPYIEISELTPLNSPYASPEAARNRAEITQLMQKHGFVPYPYEFWHYSSRDAYAEYLLGSGQPGRYGAVDFDPTTCSFEPVADPTAPLISLEELQRTIASVVTGQWSMCQTRREDTARNSNGRSRQ